MNRSLRFLLALAGALGGCTVIAKPNPFFAMNTIARGDPSDVVPLLKELGYDGLGGAAGDAAMATALAQAGLKFFNGYRSVSFQAGKPALDDTLRGQIDAMRDQDTTLWLAVSKVYKEDRLLPKDSLDAETIATAQLEEIARYAELQSVRIALYPHANSFIESVDDAMRLARKVSRPSVGVTFNLCHWLKVEGTGRDPVPVLKDALPRLMFVTINGADKGDTRAMAWGRVIQPLGRGSYDVAGLLRSLRELGYTGPVGFQGWGIKRDPREVLTETMAAWRAMQAPAARK